MNEDTNAKRLIQNLITALTDEVARYGHLIETQNSNEAKYICAGKCAAFNEVKETLKRLVGEL